jgi:hypothetical protein
MNGFINRSWLLVIAFSTGTLLSQPSIAADAPVPVTATATIDWSKLQISVTGVDGTTPTVNFSGQRTSLNSYAQAPGQSETNNKAVNNWTAPSEVNSDAGSTYSDGLASATSFSGIANWMSDSYSNSSGNRTENFTFSGPGVMTITVPYTISLAGGTSTCYYCYNYEHASVNGSANFFSNANNGNSSSSSNVSYSLTNDYYHSSPESQSGTLVFGVFANGSGNGSLSLNFDVGKNPYYCCTSPIPEPESYAMLLAGLGLMGAVARRRVKAERFLR